MKKTCMLSLTALMVCLLAGASSAALQVEVSSTPSLPAENLVKNGDFESDMQDWLLPAKPDVIESEGWKIDLSNDACQGKNALHIKVETKKASSRSRGASQSIARLFSAGKLISGKSYVVSCWVKAEKPTTNIGGIYCGAGVSLSMYSKDWKQNVTTYAKTGNTDGKWVKLVSQPLVCPDFGATGEISPAVSYTQGEAWIDDICLSEAFVDLSIKVKGDGISQVLVEDETGKSVFDSGPLSKGTKEFSKSISVLSVYKYKITVVDSKGNISEQEYPK